MANVDRRSMLGLGVAASTLVFPVMPAAQAYRPTKEKEDAYLLSKGKELAPGVRQVDMSERESVIPAYKTIRMREIIIAPGAKIPEVMNDMLCHMISRGLAVVQNNKEFTVRWGDVWACAKGITEGIQNKGDRVAVVRIIDLLTT